MILPLSSWAVHHPPLQDWLNEQLAFIYDVPQGVSQQLVQKDQILPLLDGLDEMEASLRTACIKAINVYHHEHLVPMVVCSRTTEYEAASEQERLVLNRAVLIQLLTVQQVESYLTLVDPASASLRAALREDPQLRTPLMLNILKLISQEESVAKLKSPHQIFATYVERMVKSKGDVRCYPLYQTNKSLHWLAQQMRKHNQTIFSLEQLRPDWLPEGQEVVYQRNIGFIGALSGALVGALVGALGAGLIGLTRPVSMLAFGLVGGLVGGALKLDPQGVLTWSWEVSGDSVANFLLFPIIFSLDLGLFGTLALVLVGPLVGALVGIMFFGLSGMLVGALIGALIGALVCGLFLLVFFMLDRLYFGLSSVLTSMLASALVTALVSTLAGVLHDGLVFKLHDGLVGALIGCLIILLASGRVGAWVSALIGALVGALVGWLVGTLTGALIGALIGVLVIVLVIVLMGPVLADPLSGGMEDVLGGACLFDLIGALSGGALVSWLIFRKGGGLGSMLVGGLVGILISALVFGLILGLTLELTTKLDDESGISGSGGSELIIAPIGAMIGAMGGGLGGGLGGILVGILVGILSFVLSGVLIAAIQRYILRFSLCQIHAFPWKAGAFLESATARILLRRVGGGYSFIHRLLLDYFADLEEDDA